MIMIIFIDHVSMIIIVLFYFYSQLSCIEKPTGGKSKSNILNDQNVNQKKTINTKINL